MIAVIGVFSFIGSIIFLILGILSKIKKRENARKRFQIAAVAFVLMIILMIVDPESSEPTAASKTPNDTVATTTSEPVDTNANVVEEEKAEAEEKLKTEAEAKAKLEAEEEAKIKAEAEMTSKENQDAVLKFETDIFALEEKIQPRLENYSKAITGLSEGTVDINTAYEATTRAKEGVDYVWSEISKVEIPKSIPKDVKTVLESSKSELSTAYYTKGEAFKAVLKYLDDPKPSLMQKFKDENDTSDGFIIRGISKIFEAKTLVGIDITK